MLSRTLLVTFALVIGLVSDGAGADVRDGAVDIRGEGPPDCGPGGWKRGNDSSIVPQHGCTTTTTCRSSRNRSQPDERGLIIPCVSIFHRAIVAHDKLAGDVSDLYQTQTLIHEAYEQDLVDKASTYNSVKDSASLQQADEVTF